LRGEHSVRHQIQTILNSEPHFGGVMLLRENSNPKKSSM
jgi:hypothetical protein